MLVNGHRKPGALFHKPAGQRCPHQRHTGCRIYERRPLGCRMWSCLWLVDPTVALSRPDRSHYVVDIAKDVIDIGDHNTGQTMHLAVMQVWCDPNHPDAWKDPQLIELIEQQGRNGTATLVRYNSAEGFAVFPHSMTGTGLKTVKSNMTMPERSANETVALLEKIAAPSGDGAEAGAT